MSYISKYLALFALLGSANSAIAKDDVYLINPNDLTVSGRFQLPSNTETGALQNLVVSDIEYAPSLPANLLTNDTILRSSFRIALEKSLNNHGYHIAAGGSTPTPTPVNPTPVNVALTDLVVEPTDSGYVASLTITMSYAIDGLEDGDTSPDPCSSVTAQGQYRVNRAKKRSGGQKALIGLGTLLGVPDMGKIVTVSDDKPAPAEAGADVRQHNYSEGTLDAKNDAFLVRYGVMNATQLAIADLIVQLKKSCGNSAE